MVLCFLRPNTYNIPMPALSHDFFEFRDIQDEQAASLLSKHIWRILKKARWSLTKIKQRGTFFDEVFLLLPSDFLNRVARDIVRMTEGEKYGIRGCLLIIEYCGGNEITPVGQIRCDPVLSSTCQLTLTLFRNDSKTLPKNPVLRLLRGIKAEDVICISPGYLLEKRKITKTS